MYSRLFNFLFSVLGMVIMASTTWAEGLTLAPLFSDGAVLQHGKPIFVWGKAEPGSKITVEFAGQTQRGSAQSDGHWSVKLEALTVLREPQTLRVKAADGQQQNVADVLVGDVWLCSGQSNMAWQLRKMPEAAREMEQAQPFLIRGFLSPAIGAERPIFTNEGKWSACIPEKMGDWSAVAFYFAKKLFQETGIPIGIIMTSYGGTEIETWMSEAALKRSGLSDAAAKRWAKYLDRLPQETEKWLAAKEAWQKQTEEEKQRGLSPTTPEPRLPEGKGSRRQPAGLFNAMIHPFAPFGLRGILWYQGESNVSRTDEYAALFQAMIQDWRECFQQGELPFYFVQLPNYQPSSSGDQWARLREAQMAALALPNTGMAVTIDLGEARNLHPRNKWDVGARLAQQALYNEYGKSIAPAAPIFQSVEREGNALRVRFKGSQPLILKDAEVSSFEVAGADGKYFPAMVTVDGESLLVSSAEVGEPMAVRYAWQNNPIATLYTKTGLPVSPFRSDKISSGEKSASSH